MKRLFCATMSLALVLGGCSTTKTETVDETTDQEQVLGGWQINDDNTQVALPENVQEAFNQASEEYVGIDLTPIAYLASQVVSGTNYKILCKGATVTANPETKLVVATVYENLDGNAEMTEVVDFNIDDFTEDTSDLCGGWQIPEEYNVVNLPAEVESVFSEATSTLLGMNYEPIAYLASQVVNGTNYAILCHTTTVTQEPEHGIAILVVNDKDSSVVSVTNLNS